MCFRENLTETFLQKYSEHFLLLRHRDSVDYIHNNLVSLFNNPRNESYCTEKLQWLYGCVFLLFKITWSNIIYFISDIVRWIGIKKTFLTHY